jgi:carboxyl-terminal processing protease
MKDRYPVHRQWLVSVWWALVGTIGAMAGVAAAGGCDPSYLPVQPTATASPDAVATYRVMARATERSAATAEVQAHTLRWYSSDPTPTLMPKDDRLYLFDDVWYAVDDHYFYRDFHGLDWDEIYDEYRPRVRKAGSAQEFYGLLREMIGRLKDDHSSYYPPWELDQAGEGTNYLLGIDLVGERKSASERAAVVLYVLPGSPADEAGIKRRDRILAIDGQPLENPFEDVNKIRGPWLTTVRLRVQSPGEAPREVSIERRRASGSSRPFSHRLEADPRIGYLVLPELFSYRLASYFEAELSKLLAGDFPLNGLIIDARANGGGRIDALRGILGQFFKEDEYLGRFSLIGADTRALYSNPGNLYEQLQDVPLAVLIDHDTQSAAETLAAVLQFEKRATVVGDTSAGNTEVVYPYDFDDGSVLWLAEGKYIRGDGLDLEGRGVIPDRLLSVDWTTYKERDDPHILAAVDALKRTQTPTAIPRR